MAILTSNGISVRAGSQSERGTWQQQLSSAIRDLDQLCDVLELPAEFRAKIEALRVFPVFVPPAYLARIQKSDIEDPLLLQVLPVSVEDKSVDGFVADPLAEMATNPQPGLLHKYSGRVLLVTTGVCAVNCRYCFRRHFPYDEGPVSIGQWQPALDQIAADPTVEEVLLSGGDPLMLVDEKLNRLLDKLNDVPHLKRIRIHTRMPVVVPQRISDELVALLSNLRLQTIFVIHSNHANEVDEEVRDAIARLTQAGILVFNQSVLLRGVNDNTDALVELSQRLLECNVVPYYLHQLDRVDGAAHFEVSVEKGKRLIQQMRERLPGYAVPRYVQEIPGENGKTVLA